MPFTGSGTGIQNANDVFFSGLSANQVLRYDAATSKWNNVDLTITKAQVGLGNVDNTSDTNKPISTATQSALNGKASSAITISGVTSLTGGGDLSANRTISLVGDAASPGNSKYYGTNASGTKGYFDLPTGGGSSTLAGDTDVAITSPAQGNVLSYDNGTSKWKNIPGDIPLATVSLPGSLATGTINLPFPIIGTWKFSALVITVGTSATGGSIIADLLYNGITVFGTPANRPTISSGNLWAASGAPSVNQFTGSTSVRGYLQFSLTSVGSAGTEGADLVATIYATRIA